MTRMVRQLCIICGVDRRKTLGRDARDGRDGHKMSCPTSKYNTTPQWRVVIVEETK